MKLRLNESQEELRKDKKDEGLAEDSAPRENLYGIELPISICNPFNARQNWYCKIPLNAGRSRQATNRRLMQDLVTYPENFVDRENQQVLEINKKI